MLKIYCICGMGLGTSLIAKMNIEAILAEEGIDAQVDNTDLGSVTSVNGDFYVTTEELAQSMPSELADKTIILTDFINKDGIKKSILPRLKG